MDRDIDDRDRDRYDLRGQLLFKGSDDLSVRLIGDYSKIDHRLSRTVLAHRERQRLHPGEHHRADGPTAIDTFTQELRLASDFEGPLNFLLGGFYFNESIDFSNVLVNGRDTRPYLNILGAGGLATVETILRVLAGTFFAAGTGSPTPSRSRIGPIRCSAPSTSSRSSS